MTRYWRRLDTKFEQKRKSEIETITKGYYDDPSPWLERTRWLTILNGFHRSTLIDLVSSPDTLILRILWTNFDLLVQYSQSILDTIGPFARFEAIRTKKDQYRERPLRSYQDINRISSYSTS